MATYNSEIGHLTPLTSNAIDLTQRPSTGTDSPVTSNRRSRQKPAHPLHPQFHLDAAQSTYAMAARRRQCGNTTRSPSAKNITWIEQIKAAIAVSAGGRSDATAAAARVPWRRWREVGFGS